MVPLFSLLLLGEVLAHVRPFQVNVPRAGGDAVENGIRHQLALNVHIPLVWLELGRDHGGTPALPESLEREIAAMATDQKCSLAAELWWMIAEEMSLAGRPGCV